MCSTASGHVTLCRCTALLQVLDDPDRKLPGYYQALYVLLQSLVDPDAAWKAGMAITGFNFTAFPVTRTSMLYFVASRIYINIPDARPAMPSLPTGPPAVASSGTYNSSAVALVPSEHPQACCFCSPAAVRWLVHVAGALHAARALAALSITTTKHAVALPGVADVLS